MQPTMDGDSDSNVQDVSMNEDNVENGKEKSNNKSKIKKKEVYLPGKPIKSGETLVPDESTYVVYHSAQTGCPCLSFDIIPDSLGNNRSDFPLTVYVVAGTQADKVNANKLFVMKLSNLHETRKESKNSDNESDSDSESESDEDLDEKPEFDMAAIKHNGGVNRIRCTKLGDTRVAASWSDRKSIHIWNLEEQISAVDNSFLLSEFVKNRSKTVIPPLFTFAGHTDEGFALDWSSITAGNLLSGDCKNNIHLWKMQSGGSWSIDQKPYTGHTGSVEDIQWSPNEDTVFASCSTDKTVRVWDTRAVPSKACMLTEEVHNTDVNVMSWNRTDPFIVTGSDDGELKVWDLRQFGKKDAVALFRHHSAPVTSVEWHSMDSSVFASAGADNQIVQWDLAVEPDDMSEENATNIPPQLLFIHQGQKDIKELHWHAQIPGLVISTAYDGFNIFKTISV